MEWITKLSWALLALVHASPAAVLFAPQLLRSLYGMEGDGVMGVLLVHRGALFLAIVVACVFALFDTASRRVAAVVVALSVIGFLVVYARAGWPPGALRTIAVVDLVALLPLGWVLLMAWKPQVA